MDKLIYGADTETVNGEPFCFQFFSEDDGAECADIIWLPSADAALDKLIAWCKTCRRNRQHVVYVHNLDFDAVSFMWPVKDRLASASGEFDFIYKTWRVHGCYGAPTFFRVSNGHDISVLFVDSFSWIRSSLAKAAELFCPGLPKLKRPALLGEKRFTPTDKGFCSYALRDAEVGYHLGRAIESVHQEFDVSQCVSIADTSARIFRHQYIRDTIPLPPRDILEGSIHAYHGGKNNFVGKPGWYTDVTALDISSAYPHAMHEFPAFTCAEAYRRIRVTRGAKRVPDLGIYSVRGSLDACPWPVLFSHSFKPLDPGLVEDVWVTGYELNEALRSGEFRLSSAAGFVYDASRECDKGVPPLCRFVDEFYARKSEEKDKVRRYFYKLILNSLSGKFIQTRKKQGRDTIDEDDNYTGDARLVAGGLFHPFIAALITGHTRARIHRLEHQYRAIHTATDGIITQAPIRKADLGEGLGALAVEAKGDALILRNKLYVLYGDTGEPSSVFKGKKVSKYAMHGFQGGIWELEKMVVSGRRKYSRNKPNRLRESVKRGLIANKFEVHPYTLKVGDLLVRS